MGMVLEERRAIPDDDLVSAVRAGETRLYETLMRRYKDNLHVFTVHFLHQFNATFTGHLYI